MNTFSAIGFYIFRGSNSQKNEFRKNPHNPALARKSISENTCELLLFSTYFTKFVDESVIVGR